MESASIALMGSLKFRLLGFANLESRIANLTAKMEHAKLVKVITL